MEEIRRRLIEKQEELGLNDQEFADLLGVSRVAWNNTKNRRAGLGTKVIRGALKAFPDVVPGAELVA